jgi:hypothetical protein
MLKQIESWQKLIGTALASQADELTAVQINAIAQSLILSILCLFLCEQRSVVSPERSQIGQLCIDKAASSDAVLYPQLLQTWQEIADRLGPLFPILDLPIHLHLEDQLLQPILQAVWQPDSQFAAALSVETLGQVYEMFLERSLTLDDDRQVSVTRSRHTKKAGGIYYTPNAIVDFIVQQTIAPLLTEFISASKSTLLSKSTLASALLSASTSLSISRSNPNSDSVLHSPTILDPACGSGAFLLATYRFLLTWHREFYVSNQPEHHARTEPPRIVQVQGDWQLTGAERQRILLHSIYGVDLDPDAVAMTKRCLWLALLDDNPDALHQPLPDLSQNIQCGNAVIGSDINETRSHVSDECLNPFDWDRAFPDIWRAGGFDAVIGNPPYMDSEWMTVHLPDWRHYCATHYRTATGNWDLFCVFIEKALQLCRAGGWTSLVVPNKLASANYAASARSLLAQDTQLFTIRDYSQVPVFAAAVYPLVYVAQKITPKVSEHVRYEVMQGLEQIGQCCTIRVDSTPAQRDRPWRLTTSAAHTRLIDRLAEGSPLSAIATITGAATVAEAYQLQPLIQSCQTTDEDVWLVNSGTIDRYSLLWGKKPLRYLGASYLHPVIASTQLACLSQTRQQQTRQPKIIVASMTQRLECALDATGAVLAGKSTSIIQLTCPDLFDLRYLLGLLNSRLINHYFLACFGGNQLQGGYLRIGPPQLRQIPIYCPDRSNPSEQRAYHHLIKLVDQMLTLHHQHPVQVDRRICSPKTTEIEAIDRAIDQVVYTLYRLTDSEISLIERMKGEG